LSTTKQPPGPIKPTNQSDPPLDNRPAWGVYIPTWQGWLYLATVIDCHTKACVGYAMAEHMRTELVIDALARAARNISLAEGAIFHSDRGAQYTSQDFAVAAAQLGVRRSVGRTGSCFDNAQAESFNAALKVERVNRTVYPTREHARTDVARYIEFRYNEAYSGTTHASE
jgi:putative transposase